MKEIVTLQFGSFSNYVGTHFWNFQDEILGLTDGQNTSNFYSNIDFNVLFRTGLDFHNNETYTPRLVLTDFKGSLGGVSYQQYWEGTTSTNINSSNITKKEENFYELVQENKSLKEQKIHGADTVNNNGNSRQKVMKLQLEDSVEKSQFVKQLENESEMEIDEEKRINENQNIDVDILNSNQSTRHAAQQLNKQNNVRYWTDYVKPFFHPKSIQLLNIWKSQSAFDGWGDAAQLVDLAEMHEQIFEGIRIQAEDADNLDSFRAVVDGSTGFGLLSNLIFNDLKDEFPKKDLLLFSIDEFLEQDLIQGMIEKRRKILSRSFSFGCLSENCSVFIPLEISNQQNIDFLNFDINSRYQTSSVFATAFINSLLPSQSSYFNQYGNQQQIINLFSGSHFQGPSIAQLSCCFPVQNLATEININQEFQNQINSYNVPFDQNQVLCEDIVINGQNNFLNQKQPEQIFNNAKMQQISIIPNNLPLPLSYPQIFDLNQIKQINQSQQQQQQQYVNIEFDKMGEIGGISGITRLGPNFGFKEYIKKCSKNLSQISRSGLSESVLESWGYEKDNIQEVVEKMNVMASSYGQDDFEDDEW